MDENIKDVPQQSGKWKNVFKGILRVLGSIILWMLVYNLCGVCLSDVNYGEWKAGLISYCITILLILLIVYIARLPQTNKIKKLAKGIVITFGCFIAFILIGYLLILGIRYLLPRKTILQLIIALGIIVCALLILFTILLIKWYKSKNNKLKKWIIINAVITLIVIWGGLTSAGIIPNWSGIEALCSCVDCDGQHFHSGIDHQIHGLHCCEGTYVIGDSGCSNPFSYDCFIN